MQLAREAAALVLLGGEQPARQLATVRDLGAQRVAGGVAVEGEAHVEGHLLEQGDEVGGEDLPAVAVEAEDEVVRRLLAGYQQGDGVPRPLPRREGRQRRLGLRDVAPGPGGPVAQRGGGDP